MTQKVRVHSVSFVSVNTKGKKCPWYSPRLVSHCLIQVTRVQFNPDYAWYPDSLSMASFNLKQKKKLVFMETTHRSSVNTPTTRRWLAPTK